MTPNWYHQSIYRAALLVLLVAAACRSPDPEAIAMRRVVSTPAPTSSPAPSVVPAGPAERVSSTAYCDHGRMANGRWVHAGAVARNGVAFGTRYRIEGGPLAGTVVVVSDRIGWGSEFDVYMNSCEDARRYGRRSIVVTQISAGVT